jgi:predicted membrane channel-forming protein YqfA (hemolysin III family)
VAGRLVYSLGAIYGSDIDGLRYQNAVWHNFVLAYPWCFFLPPPFTLGVLPAA